MPGLLAGTGRFDYNRLRETAYAVRMDSVLSPKLACACI